LPRPELPLKVWFSLEAQRRRRGLATLKSWFYKDLIPSQPNLAANGRRLSQTYSLVHRIEIVRLINMSEIALTTLQIL